MKQRKIVVLDVKNNPIPGCAISIWDAGTGKIKNLYRDSELWEPQENPVITDINGILTFYCEGSILCTLYQAEENKDIQPNFIFYS